MSTSCVRDWGTETRGAAERLAMVDSASSTSTSSPPFGISQSPSPSLSRIAPTTQELTETRPEVQSPCLNTITFARQSCSLPFPHTICICITVSPWILHRAMCAQDGLHETWLVRDGGRRTREVCHGSHGRGRGRGRTRHNGCATQPQTARMLVATLS